MFGSTNPSGQSSSCPFGSQSAFGQTNPSSGEPFPPKPFGTTTPFGSQTSSSLFGVTSTGVHGASQSSSPFSSPTTFGASSSPAFGNSVPAFGSSLTAAFGSSVFGQKPVSGGSGSTTQTSPFGNAGQPSQPAFGSNIFGSSTPFGASSTPLFGPLTISGVGASSTSSFGDSSTPSFSFGPTYTFGQSTSAFGSSPFGSTSSLFGGKSAPFGSQTTSAFGHLRVGSRVANYEPTAEADAGTSGQTAKLDSISAMPIYKLKSHEELKWEDYQIGDKESQTTSAFGSTVIGKSGFGGQRGGSRVANYESTAEADGGTSGQTTKVKSISAFGSTGIGKLGFGVQGVGSRVANYEPTAEADGDTSGQTVILGSISGMPIYKDKSHKELRWEDYQIGDKGGPLSSAQSTGLVGFNATTTHTNTFAPAPAFGQPAPNPFSTPAPSSPFATKSSPFSNGFGTSSTIFGTSTSAAAPSIFGSSTSTFVANSPSPVFSSSPAVGTSLPFGSSINFGNTQSSNLFSSAPAPPTIAQSGPAFGQSTSLFGQNTSAFSQSSLFNSPSSGLGGNIFSSSASLTSSNLAGFGQTAPSLSTPLLTGQAAQTGGTFAFSNFGQTQSVGASSYSGTPGIYGQSNFGLPIMVRVQVVPRFQALLFFFFWFMLLLLFFVFFLVFRGHLALLFEHTM